MRTGRSRRCHSRGGRHAFGVQRQRVSGGLGAPHEFRGAGEPCRHDIRDEFQYRQPSIERMEVELPV